ncbi:MAG: DUF1476 domain-containing protein [Alphaproteobacteria bacterium]|jgi:hypothetical protein|nr:DUF1476 domain-containing protein [Alphaproteobacteria bacterium]MDP6238087.1 DUF1476 domain-containing protein [Alphaproteobacteria bacterium]MDP7172178.1 DUF1476 domain-containing protein [Alphaproteobacteria bacterium]MDP7234004.1 DUF1476 domain-containing protein [Alphaproteobacteria bacterium]MDP7487589.1 DUF1476 domain-containing protein [Alphaproteobacteria bacterium]|tara:strand:+ start:192 stop:512 length:321 start_codon:yes stop_codon:yes gene_type:complete
MTTFDNRERDAEKKFEHDEELRFKVTARRNKLLGLWAAELLGLTGEAAEAYAKEVVLSDFERPGDEDVLEKVLRDFEGKGVNTDATKIRVQMDDLMGEARVQIMSE